MANETLSGAPNLSKVYIAGPFFNDEQVKLITAIETLFNSMEIKYFSPRSFGVLGEMDQDLRAKMTRDIYRKNIEEIDACDVMLAVIDDRDVGTIFEIGYAAALRKLYTEEFGEMRFIITISNKGYGMNVMLRESIDAHLHGLSHLRECINLALSGELDGKKFMADRGQAW